MSRRSVPNIQPTDLRDVASEERVERIWGRLEQDLGAMRARPPSRASRTMVWAVAATFAAFGGGLFAGRQLWQGRAPGPSPVAATNDRATLDVLAAGSQERSYPLPGGGSITLLPGSMVELERSGGSDVRVRLLAGEASLDTGKGADQSLAIVSGEAMIATDPGSTVRVRQRADNLDVRVAAGSARVSSPAGTRALNTGEQMDDVPTRTVTSANNSPVVRVTPIHTGRVPRGDASVAAIAVAPTWRMEHAAGNFEQAQELLKQQPGGIAGAVQNAKSAEELMAISDLARSKGGDQAAAIRALQRVADEFGSNPNGPLAAAALAKIYETSQPDLAKKYREQAAQNRVLAEDSVCAQMRADHRAGNKDEAAARAKDYLARYPNGRCKDDAIRIQEGGDASEDDDSPEPSPAVAPPGSASGAPAAPPAASSSAGKP